MYYMIITTIVLQALALAMIFYIVYWLFQTYDFKMSFAILFFILYFIIGSSILFMSE